MNRLTTVLLILALALLATPALGQTTTTPVWQHNLADHLAESLRSERPGVRAATMRLILELEQQQPGLDLSATVPPLLEIYGQDRDPSFRLLALAALRALENPYGLERLAEMVRFERSPAVRRATLLALADYRQRP